MSLIFSCRFPVPTCMKSSMLWWRRRQERSSRSCWRNLMKRTSVLMLSTVLERLCFSVYPHVMALPLCHQRMFQPTMRTESGSCTWPPPAPCPRRLPCLQSKVRLTHTSRRLSYSCLLMLLFILGQIVGLAAPCPGLPPLTGVS